MCVYVASHRWYPLSFVQVSLQPSDVQESEFDRCRILVKPALFVSAALDDEKFALHPYHPVHYFRACSIDDVPRFWMQKLFWSLSAVPRSLHMPGAILKEHSDYSMRFEFQDRGKLHVHVSAWVHFDPDYLPPFHMNGMGLVSISPAERHPLVELRS